MSVEYVDDTMLLWGTEKNSLRGEECRRVKMLCYDGSCPQGGSIGWLDWLTSGPVCMSAILKSVQ